MNTTDTEDADFLECACPHCGQALSFPVTYAGTAQMCIRCSEVVLVPKDGANIAGKLPLPLSTPRLLLRRFRADDWRDVLELWDDGEEPPDEEATIRWLEADAKRNLTDGQFLYLAMEVKEAIKVIGYAGIRYNDDSCQQAQIDVLVNRSYQRQHYGSEAVTAMFALGFEALLIHRITASCDSRETACFRMLEQVGMRREAEFVQDHFVNGEWATTLWYAILASEFQKTAP